MTTASSAIEGSTIECGNCHRHVVIGSVPLGQSIRRHADRILVAHQQGGECARIRQGVVEAVELVSAWLEDDEALRVPDTAWGLAFYEAVTTLVKAAR